MSQPESAEMTVLREGADVPVGVAQVALPARRAAPASMFSAMLKRFSRHRAAFVSMIVLLILAGISFGGPLLISEDAANRIDVRAMRQGPTTAHPFGTDDVGRDQLVRAIYGGRVSLTIGLLAAIVGVVIGLVVGVVAGYAGGWTDSLLMRLTDALLSIPTLFILILTTRIFGTSIPVITVIIGVLSWMVIARIVRASVLSLSQQEFITAAESLGAAPFSILVRHIVPNTLAPVIVAATLGVGHAIILEASLSFLGIGVQPPTSTWGTMLLRSQGFLTEAPWMAIFPGLLILLTVLCVNFIGDGLRDAMDPFSPVR